MPYIVAENPTFDEIKAHCALIGVEIAQFPTNRSPSGDKWEYLVKGKHGKCVVWKLTDVWAYACKVGKVGTV